MCWVDSSTSITRSPHDRSEVSAPFTATIPGGPKAGIAAGMVSRYLDLGRLASSRRTDGPRRWTRAPSGAMAVGPTSRSSLPAQGRGQLPWSMYLMWGTSPASLCTGCSRSSATHPCTDRCQKSARSSATLSTRISCSWAETSTRVPRGRTTVIVFGSLRVPGLDADPLSTIERVLAEYVDHYNAHRPHQAIGLRSPMSRGDRPRPAAQGHDSISRNPILGGLINEYGLAARRLRFRTRRSTSWRGDGR